MSLNICSKWECECWKTKTFCKDDETPLFCFHCDDKNSALKLWKQSQMDRHFSQQQQQKFSHDQTDLNTQFESSIKIWLNNSDKEEKKTLKIFFSKMKNNLVFWL